ncbi:MAG: single-stranded-DNA-specific exonuclease RecJ, partial [Gammaproteobacteria bacterium]|nr:single-stranded-DNA-specific exonuclease RecJ [Gammaproteobacteria bacterium]
MPASIIRIPTDGSSDQDSCPAGLSPLLWRIYRRRGIERAEQLERELTSLIPPDRMAGLEDAVDILAAAMEKDERILIVGDFDADGATSCALAVHCLRAFGHFSVDFLVPNRFTFGYGL